MRAIRAVTDANLRERLIGRIITNARDGSTRDGNTFVVTLDQYVVAKPPEAGAIIIEDCGSFEAAQARYAEVCRITYPEKFAPKLPRARR